MNETENWLHNWLISNGNPAVSKLTITDDFVAAGIIDSFGTIRLISDVESHFGVEFSDENFQRKDLTTIKGLATVIVANIERDKGLNS